ncbi:hypothetical protein NT04LM_3629a, partial [Listeria monocytogenes FSL F2-208]
PFGASSIYHYLLYLLPLYKYKEVNSFVCIDIFGMSVKWFHRPF